MHSSNRMMSPVRHLATLGVVWALAAGVSIPVTVDAASDPQGTVRSPSNTTIQLDRTGHARVGKASFYAAHYSGKTMADGTPMRLYSNNAASITLPLGTTAKVTNLETGRSALVTIRDRGPYVKGRIVDLSPATARKIGLDEKKGLAKVEVAPVTVPQADGTVKVFRDSAIVAAN